MMDDPWSMEHCGFAEGSQGFHDFRVPSMDGKVHTKLETPAIGYAD